jgi:peptide chain release factor 1
MSVLKVSGKGASKAFSNESGGHRWQRIPPNEKRGRVHSSTITVAVLPLPTETEINIDPRDLRWSTCRGSGAGGQHRNVTDSAVRVQHLPTGLVATCESERSQYRNKQTALAVLHSRLKAAEAREARGARGEDRRAQVGSGMRADKRRTIRCQDGTVKDHNTNRKMGMRAYFKGDLDKLLP